MLRMNPPLAASWQERLAYTLINFAISLLTTVVASFILYYYTDVLLLPIAAVSLLLFVVRFFDGAIDPFIAYYMDRRQTGRGKYRDYLLRWAAPLCVLSALLFLPAPFTGDLATVAWCYGVYLLWSFAISMVEAASLPLLMTMSSSPSERRLTNTIKIVGGILASLLARYATLELVSTLGGGSERRGFAITMALFSALALLALVFGGRRVVERSITAPNPFSLGKAALLLLKDKPIFFLFFFFLFSQLGSSVKSQSTMYYMKYFVNRQDLTSVFLVIGIGSSLAAQPIIMRVTKRLPNIALIVAGYVGGALSMLLMGFAGTSLPLLLVGNVLYGVATAFPANLIYVYTAELTDGLIRETGAAFGAIVHSLLGLSSRIGLSLAGAIVPLVLSITAYVPNAPQSDASLTGIQVTFVLMTFVFYCLASLFAYLSYRTSRNRHPGVN